MDAIHSKALFDFGIALPAVGLIFLLLLPRLWRERFQQRLFKVRNDLFEQVWKEGLSFNDPAYRHVRDTINGGIQLASEFRVPTFLMIALWSKCGARIASSDIRSEDERLQELLDGAERKMAIEFMMYLWISPWGVALIPLAIVCTILAILVGGVVDKTKRASAHVWNSFAYSFKRPAYLFLKEAERMGSRTHQGHSGSSLGLPLRV